MCVCVGCVQKSNDDPAMKKHPILPLFRRAANVMVIRAILETSVVEFLNLHFPKRS